MNSDSVRDQTITDFGDQWTRHTTNEGYYGSVALLADITGPFVAPHDFCGQRCAEIGSGTGRIVRMLLDAGAAHVTAIEPSRAFAVLVNNTAAARDRVTCINQRGDDIPPGDFDYVLSIGVLHHIPDPQPVVDAAWRSLRDGGTMLIWVYGHEGSRPYQWVLLPIRYVSRRIPIWANEALSSLLYPCVVTYWGLTTILPFLPLRDYLNNVYFKFDKPYRKLVILDQINPAWAKYYRQDEAEQLLRQSGFVDVQSHHRRGYSWTVCGTKRVQS